MSHLSVYALGRFHVTLNGEPVTAFESDKVRALLAYLAVEGDRPHSRERLVGLLWPDWPEAGARQNLSQALYNLREVIGDRQADPPFVIVTRQTLQFNRASDAWLDVAVFADLLAACRHHDHPRLELCDACTARLAEAVALYRGSFLEDLSLPRSAALEDWARGTREELDRRALETFHSLSACYEAHGELEAALAPARRAVMLDPCWEQGERGLMRLLALSGQTSTALAQYERLARVLEEELGVAPAEETQELHRLLLQGQRPPAILATTAIVERKPRPVGACPYRGLAAFREQDAPFFHGREVFGERLVDAVRQRPMVAVIVGSSGSGKSSAVFAGLLPRLRSQPGWVVAQLRPGGHPFEATAAALLPLLEPAMSQADRLIETRKLAAALRGGQVPLLSVVERLLAWDGDRQRLLLVVDQFEELYTLCPEPARQRAFVELLLAAVKAESGRWLAPLALLLTLRADFMGQALSHRPLADVLQEGSVILGPMSREELRAVIETPAEAQGAAFEAGLVERILADVGQEPGNLPLLEFALTLLWENNEHGWLTHAGYEAIGRVEGALARYADQVYGQLDNGEREQARRIFIQLVRPGEGTEDTRRVATQAELGVGSWALVGHLADRRLVVTGRDQATGQETVEVVHEALIQRWGQLRAWMEVDRTFRSWQERLRAARSGWEASGRDDGGLLRGAPLSEAEHWLAERTGELSAAERDYIGAGVALRRRRRAELERRRRVTVAALAGGLVVAAILTLIALVARQQATENAAVARVEADGRATAEAIALREGEEARRQASVGLAARALAELEGTAPDRAVLLALEALEHYPHTPQAQSALAQAVQQYRPPTVLELAYRRWSPDGRWVAAMTNPQDGPDLFVLDAASGARLRHITVTTVDVCWLQDLFWSPAGDRLAVTTWARTPAVECPTLTVWDVTAGALLLDLSAEAGFRDNLAWSPDGRAFITGGEEGVLRVWDSDSGAMRLAVAAHAGRIQEMALSPTGDWLATASRDATARVWDLRALLAHEPAEPLIAGPASGAEALILSGHADGVNSLAWSPAGDRLVTASDDGTVRVWRLPDGQTDGAQVLLSLAGHSGAVRSVAWSPDGRHIGTLGVDCTVRAWDAAEGTQVFRQNLGPGYGGTRGDIRRVTWSPDGEIVLLTDDYSWAWELPRETLQLVGHSDDVYGTRWSPDGTRIATDSYDGTWRIWDAATGEQLLAVEHELHAGSTVHLFYLSWSPDGTRVVTAGRHGRTEIWDATTGELLVVVPRPPVNSTCTANWSPDGTRIATGSYPDNVVVIFDAGSGEVLTTFGGQGCFLHDPTWSPDGKTIATGCSYAHEATYPDGYTPARIWDAVSGELLLTLPSHDVLSYKAVWSPDGEHLAIAHDYLDLAFVAPSAGGRTAEVWRISPDAPGGGLAAELLLTFAGHTDGVGDIRWSPDGAYIASGDRDGMVRVWDPTTGAEVFSFQVPGQVFGLDWSPDGTRLVVGGRFDTPQAVRVWTSTEELIEYAYHCCVTRQLTAEERAQLGLPAAGDR